MAGLKKIIEIKRRSLSHGVGKEDEDERDRERSLMEDSKRGRRTRKFRIFFLTK